MLMLGLAAFLRLAPDEIIEGYVAEKAIEGSA
jgi:hypothetical protein